MTVRLQTLSGQVQPVSAERTTIKYSSLESGVFILPLNPLHGEGFFLAVTIYLNCGPVHESMPMNNSQTHKMKLTWSVHCK